MTTRSNDIRLGENAVYTRSTGYVLLRMPAMSLRPILYGVEFSPKTEFHCSVLNIARLAAGNPVVGLRLLRAAGRYLSEQPPQLTGFTGDVYCCSASDDRRSIIGLIGLKGMDDLYENLRNVVPDLSDPVPHITTHTYGTNSGIAVANKTALAERCSPLPEDVAVTWRAQVGYQKDCS